MPVQKGYGILDFKRYFFSNFPNNISSFSLTPQDKPRVAVVGCPGAVDVGALEVGHLDEAVLGRLGVVTLHL